MFRAPEVHKCLKQTLEIETQNDTSFTFHSELLQNQDLLKMNCSVLRGSVFAYFGLVS